MWNNSQNLVRLDSLIPFAWFNAFLIGFEQCKCVFFECYIYVLYTCIAYVCICGSLVLSCVHKASMNKRVNCSHWVTMYKG